MLTSGVSGGPTGLRQADSAVGSGSALAKATVDYDMFLELLVAQMQNQDPLNPAESTEYVAQLATFSQVEQSIQMNERLDQMLAGLQLAQSDAIIGRTVTSPDGTITGRVGSVQISSDGLIANLDTGQRIPIVPGTIIA